MALLRTVNTEHPTYHVRFYVLATILGIGIHEAIEHLSHDPNATSFDTTGFFEWLLFTFYVFTSINFFHGKVLVAEDEEVRNRLIGSPLLFLVEFALIAFVFVSVALAGAFVCELSLFILFQALVRFFDLILVDVAQRMGPRDTTMEALVWWRKTDIAGILVLGICFLILAYPFAFKNLLIRYGLINSSFHFVSFVAVKDIVITIFCIYILVDVWVDYWQNRRMFFPKTDDWIEIADFWDALQDQLGDIYRRKIIVPQVVEVLNTAKGADSLRMLDLGCGNGCVARAIWKDRRNTTIVGIDNVERMIDLAKRRTSSWHRTSSWPDNFQGVPPINFERHDITKEKRIGDPFDVVLACFSLQDAENLSDPIKVAAHNLKPDGLFVVVFENEEAFSDAGEFGFGRRPALAKGWNIIPWILLGRIRGQQEHHTPTLRATRRVWVEPVKRHPSETGRKARILWDRRTLLTVQSDDSRLTQQFLHTEFLHQVFTTITHCWPDESYTLNAKQCGLKIERGLSKQPLLPEESTKDSSNLLLDYIDKPRFSLLVFKKAISHAT
jgi:SAM-dependent methyltransferase